MSVMDAGHLTALAAAASIALGGCGDQPGPDPVASTSTTTTTEQLQPGDDAAGGGASGGRPTDAGQGDSRPPDDRPSGPAESGDHDPRVTALERAAGRTVRRYVAALDDRDGAAVCELLAPGAIDAIDLPKPRSDCAASLEASIGYRDPRGLPVWQSAEATNLRSVEIDAGSAKVVVTTATRFADRDEVSIEDDIVYLVRGGGGWLIAKPSSTLYRSVGIADVPSSVLAPPA